MKKSVKVALLMSTVLLIIICSIAGAFLFDNVKRSNSQENNSGIQSTNITLHADDTSSTGAHNTASTNDLSVESSTSKQNISNNGATNKMADVNFDRTNQTEAARLAKAYYQRIGQDGDTLVYNGYLIDDGPNYEVRVSDVEIQKSGGSGTVDLLQVDKNNNVIHVNN
ncbi:hypothetical protein ACRHK7_06790 [Weissella tructae]|uniref:Uncharacterized protein n=2 Tax=Weissella TaxID=46255 RepID=A0A075U5S5_9LACO|nr:MULTISPECIES: hypothetical protein [Weissella]AIG65472.1 hypothetical protein WS08_0533 [Weissella tructae]AIM62786.1 hypothetical protein WS74_0534 [Weissella ceti]AIM64121.1 hypothetical protein WS105_0531 [Weissella ceti]ELA07068.1 hypothetical protein WCNC_05792 [Weissella ceti NC36]QVV91846.1 hypothetical protein KHQ32_02930 [Weissella tructae]